MATMPDNGTSPDKAPDGTRPSGINRRLLARAAVALALAGATVFAVLHATRSGRSPETRNDTAGLGRPEDRAPALPEVAVREEPTRSDLEEKVQPAREEADGLEQKADANRAKSEEDDRSVLNALADVARTVRRGMSRERVVEIVKAHEGYSVVDSQNGHKTTVVPPSTTRRVVIRWDRDKDGNPVVGYCVRAVGGVRASDTEIRINWQQAMDILKSGMALRVDQFHNLEVRILTQYGERYVTRQPRIDQVLHVIESLEPHKRGVRFGTE